MSLGFESYSLVTSINEVEFVVAYVCLSFFQNNCTKSYEEGLTTFSGNVKNSIVKYRIVKMV